MIDVFKGKKITVMGLGLLGGAVNDVNFLAEHGADLIVTDLKSAAELEPSLKQLEKYAGIKYVLGGHHLEDFRGRDLILQPGNVPLDSPYLAEARKNNIPVLESEALFMEYAKDVTTIGVTGTRGKSTVTHLIYEILKANGNKVFLGGNVKGMSTLALLDIVQPGDHVVLELDSWALNGLGAVKKSPHIAVFTNFMDDHMNFYKGDVEAYFADKANIYRWQNSRDVLITDSETLQKIRVRNYLVNARIVEVGAELLPRDWYLKIRGEHNRKNVAYAVAAARELGINDPTIKKVVEEFSGLPGRLELVRELDGVMWINDTNGTTPDAVIAALRAYEDKKGKIVLIGGGADKNLDYGEYIKTVPEYIKALVLFKGSASEKILSAVREEGLGFRVFGNIASILEAVTKARELSEVGGVVILSPGAASFGMFTNEYDRGTQFDEQVKNLK